MGGSQEGFSKQGTERELCRHLQEPSRGTRGQAQLSQGTNSPRGPQPDLP